MKGFRVYFACHSQKVKIEQKAIRNQRQASVSQALMFYLSLYITSHQLCPLETMQAFVCAEA